MAQEGLFQKTMSLQELICRECIQLETGAESRDALLASMVGHLARAGVVTEPDAVLRALLDREDVMSTAVGGGVAIPHAQSAAVKSLTVGLARPKEDLDFHALDGKPVRLVFLIVGPEERSGFIRILARLSRLLHAGALQRRLLEATGPDEAVQIIAEEESRL